MPQTMYRDDRDLGPVAVPFQNIVDGGIVGVFLEHENRLIFRNVLYQCGVYVGIRKVDYLSI